jgi:type IV pilus assembly protein PilB
MVGISDPANIFLIDEVKRRIRRPIRLAVVAPADIQRVAEDCDASQAPPIEEIIKEIDEEDTLEVVASEVEDVTNLAKQAGESPVIRYVNYVITNAVREGASDIHIEPGDRLLKTRYRIDGILFEQTSPPFQMHANLDIAERRLPQDGRIRAMVHGRNIDLRISILPTTHGEKCVIRILDNRSIMVGLEELGMGPDTLAVIRQQIEEPHGVVIVTGPTGSGKTTTLYSALRCLDGSKLNVSTVEDPVEYELDFANQVNVHDRIGLSFAAALRSLLRQDPDVIMVGEIRDEETARIAIQASLTGHLVLTTLHTNDAPSSITRMINIGIEPYLISASVNAVLAQRLVRRICSHCKKPASGILPVELLRRYGVDPKCVMIGEGCPACRNSGYQGRMGIYELLKLDDDMRDLITRSPSLVELRRYCHQQGMHSLRQDGFRKVSEGITTVEEVLRVTETETTRPAEGRQP